MSIEGNVHERQTVRSTVTPLLVLLRRIRFSSIPAPGHAFAPASVCTGYPLGELGPEDNRSDPPYDTLLVV